MLLFRCPVCKGELTDTGKSLVCDKLHCFDKAKSGYTNLLLSSQMNTKHPGDNKRMVDKRTQFLSHGYYKKLIDTLNIQIVKIVRNQINENKLTQFNILDAGCGEGYYTAGIAEALKCANVNHAICGIDISKEALKVAAKRDKDISFGVASIFDLPIADKSMDMVVELFAPFSRNELDRVLKDNGILLLVIPGQYHLYEMKKAIYDNPYENEMKPVEIEGFEFLEKITIDDEIEIDNSEDIQSLFLMTPYAYKTSVEDTKRLMELKSLKTRISFLILCYKHKG